MSTSKFPLLTIDGRVIVWAEQAEIHVSASDYSEVRGGIPEEQAMREIEALLRDQFPEIPIKRID